MMLILIPLALFGWIGTADDEIDDRLRELIASKNLIDESIRGVVAESQRLHDAGELEASARHEQMADDLVEQRRELLDEIRREMDALVAAQLDDLSSSRFETREAASRRIAQWGQLVIPSLVYYLDNVEDVEARSRIHQVLSRFGLRLDSQLVVRQWVEEADASTQYGDDSWSANQMVGAPDTFVAGDIATAWAPAEANGGEQWVRVTFAFAVVSQLIRIHQTCVPGAIVRVEAIDPDGRTHEIWSGDDPSVNPPVWFEVSADGVITRELHITLDTDKVAGWNEIDAIELVGELHVGSLATADLSVSND